MDIEVFNAAMVSTFTKLAKPTNFISNFYKEVYLDGIIAEIQGKDVKSTYSIDTQIGTGGRRHDFSYHETKDVIVPEYNDFTTITELDVFKRELGDTKYTVPGKTLVKKVVDKQLIFNMMQERAEEKQAVDALLQGKITLSNKEVIEFRKKATHNITPTNRWTVVTHNPINDIEAACELCITDGKISTTEFNLILESKGFNALLNNPLFRENANLKNNIKRADISMPVADTKGGVFHGQFSAGAYIINLWSYNAKYEIPEGYGFQGEGTSVPYITVGSGILLPMEPEFERMYGAINKTNFNGPNLIAAANEVAIEIAKVKRLPYAYPAITNGSGVVYAGVKSRPLYYPKNVDSFATFSGVAQ